MSCVTSALSAELLSEGRLLGTGKWSLVSADSPAALLCGPQHSEPVRIGGKVAMSAGDSVSKDGTNAETFGLGAGEHSVARPRRLPSGTAAIAAKQASEGLFTGLMRLFVALLCWKQAQNALKQRLNGSKFKALGFCGFGLFMQTGI